MNYTQIVVSRGVVFAILFGLSACGSSGRSWERQPVVDGIQAETLDRQQRPASLAKSGEQQSSTLEMEAARPQLFIGELTSRNTAEVSSSTRQAIVSMPTLQGGGDISLSFSQTPVEDAVQIILDDYLELSYTIDSDVAGNVTLARQDAVRKSELLPLLQALLTQVDAELLERDNVYQVRRSDFAAVVDADTAVLTLKYVDVNEFAKVVSAYDVTTANLDGNRLLVRGSPKNVAQIRSLATSFDVDWMRGLSIGLFPIVNTDADNVRDELLLMFGDKESQRFAADTRVVTIRRSNSVMVIAPGANTVHEIGKWVARLDSVSADSNHGFHIYRVQNGRAQDLAELLQQMFGAKATKRAPVDDETSNQGEIIPLAMSDVDQNFRVIADDSTNSLIITGSPHYFRLIRRAMEQLDSVPLQVLVEARIMELTLTDDLKYGLEWYLNGSRAGSSTPAQLDLGISGIGFNAPGFSYVVERAGQVRAALNALADDSRLKVLSSPSLMVLNNQTASILVGDEVPIPTRQAISNISPDAPTVNEIEYRNTGILLSVSPRVNSGGMVTMDVSQEVSSVADTTSSDIDAPTIQQRRLNSTVSIQSGQTVVLGGLIREQESQRESGVPLLKNIPGLGKLFSTTNSRQQRTELVVLITPRVILDERDSSAITEEFRRKMIGLKPISLGQY